MNNFWSPYACALLALCLAPFARAADCVTPTDRVTNAVTVRESPSAANTAFGSLKPGTNLPLVGAAPGWYQVLYAPEQFGYVSKAWTRLMPCGGTSLSPLVGTTAPSFEIHAVDVGTGLSIVVRGEDFTVIYDGGSNDDVAKGADNRLLAYLATLQPAVTSIDHLLLSHPHRDHVELLPDLVQSLPPTDIWDSGRFHDICGYRSFLEQIAANTQIRYHTAMNDHEVQTVKFPPASCEGASLPGGEFPLRYDARIAFEPIQLGRQATMTFVLADGAPHGSPNENSLVVRLDLGAISLLLVGDAEAGGRAAPTEPPKPKSLEGRLLSCCQGLLPADILVVGHHGSMSSSRKAFLDAIGAQQFIISSGPFKYSSVTLPDSIIEDELEKRGTVWKTYSKDVECRTNAEKVGADADGKPGGCSNVVLTLRGTEITGSVAGNAD